MSQLGLGVMIQMLGGNEETVNSIKASIGKTIVHIKIDKEQKYDGCLVIDFSDSTTLLVWDAGRSCCEERYLHTDDDLDYFIGGDLLDMELAEAPETTDEYGEPHEQMFLHIKTSKGTFTIETHNIHNGYYGGFYIKAELVANTRPADD